MRKTSVYLTLEETRGLAVLAEREGTSQAEIIRRAINAYARERRDRNFAVAGVAAGPGGSVADLPEGELLEGFGT